MYANRRGLGLSIMQHPLALELEAPAPSSSAADAPTVELGLEYDPEPYGRLTWGLPAWLALLGGAYVVARAAGLRV